MSPISYSDIALLLGIPKETVRRKTMRLVDNQICREYIQRNIRQASGDLVPDVRAGGLAIGRLRETTARLSTTIDRNENLRKLIEGKTRCQQRGTQCQRAKAHRGGPHHYKTHICVSERYIDPSKSQKI